MAGRNQETDEQDRLSDVYRQWKLARSRSPRGRWWEKQLRFGDVGLTVAFFATFFLIFIDLALRAAPPAEPAKFSRSSWWLVALIVLFLANAEILGRILQNRTPRTLPAPWRIGTALARGVPFLGLYVFAVAARWMPGSEEKTPVSLERPRSPSLSRLRSLGDRWSRVVVREWSAMLYFVINLIGLFWILPALPGPTWSTIGLSMILHATAASGLMLHARAGERTNQAVQVPLAILLVPASLTLFTVPFIPFLGYVLYVFAVPRMAERSLIRTLQESRSSTSRLPRWLELQDTLRRARRSSKPRQGPSSPPVPEEVRELKDADRYLLWTYAIKSAVLVFDGAALSWLAFWATEGPTSQRGAVQTVISVIAGVSLAVGGIGLLLMLIRTLQNRVRAEGRLSFLDRHPVHRYLAVSQLAFATGLILGGPLFAGDGREVGAVISLAALGGTVVAFPRLFLSAPGEEDRTSARAGWTAFFAVFAISGAQWANGHESTEAMLWLFQVCLVFFPLTIPLFVFRQLLIRLLRPFGLRDMVDPEWSRPVRYALLFLTVTALLPLGGLAVPAWIWIRYRYWPEFEREWHKRMSRSKGAGRRED